MKREKQKIEVVNKLKDVGALFLVLLVAFITISLFTYDPEDISQIKYPPNEPPKNLCGKTGAWISYFLYLNFGVGAILIVFLTGYWAYCIFMGQKISLPYLKAAACILLIFAICAFFSIQSIIDVKTIGLDRTTISTGGVYGKAFEILLVKNFGRLGSYLFLTLIIGLCLLSTTDIRFYPAVLKIVNKINRVVSSIKFRNLSPPSPTPPKKLKPEPAVETKPATKKEKMEFPPLAIFEDRIDRVHDISTEHIKARSDKIESALSEFGISAKVVNYEIGPTVTLYEIEVSSGVKYSKIASLCDDIAIRLAVPSVRVVAPLPGKSTIGIEVPNPYPDTVRIKEFFLKLGVDNLSKITAPLLLGKTNSGEFLVANLVQMPHLLIAGTTSSGKSVCLKSIICGLISLLPSNKLKLLLVDPKMVEFSIFKDIPHLWTKVITDVKETPKILQWLTKEMDERYALLKIAQVSDIDSYNKLTPEELKKRLLEEEQDVPEDLPMSLPYIVLVIDEFADLIALAPKEVEYTITRLSQKSRAVGIHLVIATQRPSVDIITGLIKSNLPARISFKVASKVDSRTILDQNGAERLLGKGDMLVLLPEFLTPVRAQCTYVSEKELRELVQYMKTLGTPQYHKELIEIEKQSEIELSVNDEIFERAVEVILAEKKASASLLQRRLGIGYPRAARIIDVMEKLNIVGRFTGTGTRDVLITPEDWKQMKSKID